MANEVRLIDAVAYGNRLFDEIKKPWNDQAFITGIVFADLVLKEMPTIDPESLRPKGWWDTTDMHK